MSVTFAENSLVLLEKGIFLEETKNDYAAANEVYAKALKETKRGAKKREILFRLAVCARELGNTEDQLERLKVLVKTGDPEDEWVKKAVNAVEEYVEKNTLTESELNKIRDVLLKAIESNDLALFHSVCDKTMKEAITKNLLTSVNTQVAKSLKSGYKLKVKSINKDQIYNVYEWWVECENEVKFIMNMSLDWQNKVAGCWLR